MDKTGGVSGTPGFTPGPPGEDHTLTRFPRGKKVIQETHEQTPSPVGITTSLSGKVTPIPTSAHKETTVAAKHLSSGEHPPSSDIPLSTLPTGVQKDKIDSFTQAIRRAPEATFKHYPTLQKALEHCLGRPVDALKELFQDPKLFHLAEQLCFVMEEEGAHPEYLQQLNTLVEQSSLSSGDKDTLRTKQILDNATYLVQQGNIDESISPKLLRDLLPDKDLASLFRDAHLFSSITALASSITLKRGEDFFQVMETLIDQAEGLSLEEKDLLSTHFRLLELQRDVLEDSAYLVKEFPHLEDAVNVFFGTENEPIPLDVFKDLDSFCLLRDIAVTASFTQKTEEEWVDQLQDSIQVQTGLTPEEKGSLILNLLKHFLLQMVEKDVDSMVKAGVDAPRLFHTLSRDELTVPRTALYTALAEVALAFDKKVASGTMSQQVQQMIRNDLLLTSQEKDQLLDHLFMQTPIGKRMEQIQVLHGEEFFHHSDFALPGETQVAQILNELSRAGGTDIKGLLSDRLTFAKIQDLLFSISLERKDREFFRQCTAFILAHPDLTRKEKTTYGQQLEDGFSSRLARHVIHNDLLRDILPRSILTDFTPEAVKEEIAEILQEMFPGRISQEEFPTLVNTLYKESLSILLEQELHRSPRKEELLERFSKLIVPSKGA